MWKCLHSLWHRSRKKRKKWRSFLSFTLGFVCDASVVSLLVWTEWLLYWRTTRKPVRRCAREQLNRPSLTLNPRVINFKFPLQLQQKYSITSHSMKNLTCNSLVRWKIIVLTNSHHRLGERTLILNLGVKGLKVWPVYFTTSLITIKCALLKAVLRCLETNGRTWRLRAQSYSRGNHRSNIPQGSVLRMQNHTWSSGRWFWILIWTYREPVKLASVQKRP